MRKAGDFDGGHIPLFASLHRGIPSIPGHIPLFASLHRGIPSIPGHKKWRQSAIFSVPFAEACRRTSAFAVAAPELVNLTGGIDDFLLAGVKRVATRTDFDVQIFTGRGTGFKGIAAAASHGDFLVSGMNVRFHGWFLWIMASKGRT